MNLGYADYQLDALSVPGPVRIAADAADRVLLLEDRLVVSAAEPKFLVLYSSVPGVQFWFVNQASPLVGSTVVGPKRFLRPLEMTSEKRFSVGSKPAIVISNPTGQDVLVEAWYGRGVLTTGARSITRLALHADEESLGVEISDRYVLAGAGGHYINERRVSPFRAVRPVRFSRITTGVLSVGLGNPDVLRRTFFVLSQTTAAAVAWGGSTVSAELWLTTDSGWTDPLTITSPSAGSTYFGEGELEADAGVWPVGTQVPSGEVVL